MNKQQLVEYLKNKKIDDDYNAICRSVTSMIHNKYKNYVKKYKVMVKKEQYLMIIYLCGKTVAILSSNVDTYTVREAIHTAINAATTVEANIIECIKEDKQCY